MSFVQELRGNAAAAPAKSAVRYCAGTTEEELDYAALDRAARATADWLAARAAPGERVLLSFQPGTGFLRGFLGCLYAGLVPVPVPAPGGYAHQVARTTGIARDCAAVLVLTDAQTLPAVRDWLADGALEPLTAASVEEAERAGDPEAWRPVPVAGRDTAFLQYTSGSTSEPKGVTVPHGALVHNIGLMRRSHGWTADMTWCSWLPAYHDMGLIAMMLTPLYLGGTAVLMPASDFLKRPVSWLRLIDRHRAEISCAPNFAYDLCARRLTPEQTEGLDLSRWRYACNGAEPIHAATLDLFAERFAPHGFRREALLPGYGLAESTLYVSGTPADEAPRVLHASAESGTLVEGGGQALVSSGVVRDLDVRVVDPATGGERGPGEVGEIWIRGASVASGYWNRPAESARTFGAATAGGEAGFLRTGDLGALLDGHLYVTGRIKEMIIVHGKNLYPHDIEREVRELDPAFEDFPSAVFSVRAGAHEEIVVIQETRTRGLSEDDLAALARRARTALSRRLGLRVGGFALVKVSRIRRTTSGKIQRAAMRDLFLRGALHPAHADLAPELGALLPPPQPPAPAPGPAPASASAPTLTPGSASASAPALTPGSASAPASAPALTLTPGSGSAPGTASEADPAPAPTPGSGSAPGTASEADPAPAPTPGSASAPGSAPWSAPALAAPPTPAPGSAPTPGTASEADPASASPFAPAAAGGAR
ncbi:AMP-binding protein [Streptomyces sp. NPDC057011]|uniref:fatty acyl-AMP ligase n=1 Tax=unclassified Streptomyces TaxID=2593676 RepID=UPI003631466E